MDANFIERAIGVLNIGGVLTLKIFISAIVLGFLVGLITALMRTSKILILKAISRVYVELVRGTPLLVQLFFIYFGLNTLEYVNLSAVQAGIITVGINAGAYLSEIIRAGIQGIDKGQLEAARSLGMGKTKTMIYIVLPQAFRRMLPAFVNQCIISLKDTSLLSAIGIAEITQQGEMLASDTYMFFETWIIVGIYYLILSWILSMIGTFLERKYEIK